jgi:hypothetical protein
MFVSQTNVRDHGVFTDKRRAVVKTSGIARKELEEKCRENLALICLSDVVDADADENRFVTYLL